MKMVLRALCESCGERLRLVAWDAEEMGAPK